MSDSRAIRLLHIADGPAGPASTALAEIGPGRIKPTFAPQLDEALTQLRHAEFDLVLLDLAGQDRDVLDALVQLGRRAPAIPVLVLLDACDEETVKRALQVGAQHVLEKSDARGRVLQLAMWSAIERHLAFQALRDSLAMLQSLYDNAPLMMGMVELREDDLIHVSDNAAAAAFFGLTPEGMKDRRASDLAIPPRVLEEWIGRYEKSLRTGRPVSFEYADEHPSGIRWLSITVRPLSHVKSRYPRFCYVAKDITESKQADDQLAWATLERGAPFHLGIVDSSAPAMNVYELAQTIRADDRLASTKLILLIPQGRRSEVEWARQTGFEACVSQPIHLVQLYDCLAHVLGRTIEHAPGSAHSEPGLPRSA